MWNSNIFRKASLAIGGIGFVVFQATTFFGDVKIRIKNSAKAHLANPQVKLTEGFIFKDTITHEIKSKHASSFWVFPNLWFPYLGSKGVASWEITPDTSDPNKELKTQRLVVLWSAKLLQERKLGVGLTKTCDDVNASSDVKFLDFHQLIDNDELDGVDVFELKTIKKGKNNEIIVDTGNLTIVGSMGSQWRPFVNVELRENTQKASLAKRQRAREDNTSMDTESPAVESNSPADELKKSKVQDLKILILLLVVIACKTYS